MNNLILDCTLRDGGYVNNWEFGIANIKKIVGHLTDANIDIIECGFLSNKQNYDPNKSVFNSIDNIKEVIPKNRHKSKYVCMINFGEYELRDIPDYDGTSVDGIRVVFHKQELEEALNYCRELKIKGYMLFIQPMVTINFSDYELLKIVEVVNEIKPYSFYIVDSFGVMRKNDLLRIFYLVDNNLHQSVNIGYHSHNNLQLAYSNAQALVEVHSSRTCIIDSSVFGMGRGAGNLNTELFIQFLNDNFEKDYNVYPLLMTIDETLSKIYSTNYWGYSLPHYLSAVYNCHPNYASYLSEKNTLSIKAIQDILSKIPEGKKGTFNKKYTEDLYSKYQKRHIDDSQTLKLLQKELKNQIILVIAPGSSIEEQKGHVQAFIDENNPVCISVNFIPTQFKSDYNFISNAKRFENMSEKCRNAKSQYILTSNIEVEYGKHYVVNYEDLLNSNDTVSDNSTLMLLKLLQKIGIVKIYIAGFDGYTYDNVFNYANQDLMLSTNIKQIKELNRGIAKVVNELKNDLELVFLTPTKYSNLLLGGRA